MMSVVWVGFYLSIKRPFDFINSCHQLWKFFLSGLCLGFLISSDKFSSSVSFLCFLHGSLNFVLQLLH